MNFRKIGQRSSLVSRIWAPSRRRSATAAGKWGRARLLLLSVLMAGAALEPQAKAASIPYPLSFFLLTNSNADGTAVSPDGGISVILTGGNNGSGLSGTTDLLAIATGLGSIQFQYTYFSLDAPTFDRAGYLIGDQFTPLADTTGQFGTALFLVVGGDSFGFRVATDDNPGEPGVFTISDFSVASPAVPEPATLPLVLAAATAMAVGIRRGRYLNRKSGEQTMRRFGVVVLLLALPVSWTLHAQGQSFYSGVGVTGLKLTRTVNLTQQALSSAKASLLLRSFFTTPEQGKVIPLLRAAPLANSRAPQGASPKIAGATPLAGAGTQSLSVDPGTQAFGFDGLTHAQQRLANNGNQFNVEPPSPSLAVGNGYVLEGVNNAVQVYSLSGAALLPTVLSTNQVVGLAPAIDYATGIQGVFPTDIRVFFDSGINRWFILQRAQDSDAGGYLLPSSHLYLAVSQTGDPTGTYNIYVMDTTNSQNFFGCPCFPDYLQIGADQYGFYITADEYNAFSPFFVDATILAISKTSLAAGAVSPTAVQFTLPFATGYEFAIQPATTPPGASNFVASGGVEFFVSSQARFSIDNSLAVWAMTNTSTLLISNPNMQLIRINIPTQTYSYPDVANQKPGPLPYGSSLTPPGTLAVLDGNDDRVLSLCYSGGRLYLTLATAVRDDAGQLRVGGAYFILSPSFRNGTLAASVLRQGYLQVNGNHR